MAARVVTVAFQGVEARRVEVEAQITARNATEAGVAIVGLGDKAVAYVEVSAGRTTLFGVGAHANIITASLLAVLSAANRAIGRGLVTLPAAGTRPARAAQG